MKSFAARVEEERPYLVRYASLQLRDRHAAEDCVQEALVAALAGEASFGGRSNLRTWLTGILKHKIVDAIRRMSYASAAAIALPVVMSLVAPTPAMAASGVVLPPDPGPDGD
jgi:RNA polymerase sigma factor (sigma-70 family)